MIIEGEKNINELEKQLEKQRKEAHERAKLVKKGIYGEKLLVDGVEYETGFGMKTIQDLINQKNKQANDNFLAFEQDEGAILSHSTLLRDVKYIQLKNISEQNMAYIHVFGPQNVCTYYVNTALTTVQQVLDLFNKDQETKIQIDYKVDKYGIGNRLEPGFQINDGVAKSEIIKYVEENEGVIKQLNY